MLLAPLVVLTWLGVGLMIVGILVYLALAGLIYLPVQWFAASPATWRMVLFGRDLVEGRETGCPTPVWLETSCCGCTRLVHAPLAVCLLGLISLTAFRRIRSQLLPFLVSRGIVAGAGMVDDDGQYLVAGKAPAINCVLGLGGFLNDRPIFTFGHFFKAICVSRGCRRGTTSTCCGGGSDCRSAWAIRTWPRWRSSCGWHRRRWCWT